jgi:ribosomal protein S18 acetylase RimI-like enzyme
MINTKHDLTIRPVSMQDADLLRELSITTFTDTYSAYNTAENMQLYVTEYFNRETLLHEITSNENFFFIATINDQPAGYMKLRTLVQPAELNNKNTIELERIYVVKKFQGTGLGHSLIQYAIEYSRSQRYDILWLGVWKQNEKAIKFYTKCEFEIFGEHPFILGTDEQVDWLMKKELKS